MAATYKEYFQSALEEWLGAYGKISEVLTLANVYQGQDPTARHYVFQDWLETASFVCNGCGAVFNPDPQDVEEEDHVLCFKCANR